MSGKLKEVRNRISSINSTQQITKAMKLVAASKLRRAQQAITQMRPYSKKLTEMLGNIVSASEGGVDSTFATHRDPNNVLIIVITSDRGLCGGFNSQLIKKTENLLKEKYAEQRAKGNVSVLGIGKKGNDYFKRYKDITLVSDHVDLFTRLSFENVSETVESVMEAYSNEEYDVVEVVYSEFVNAVVQEVRSVQTMPIQKIESNEGKSTKSDYIFEPSKEILLEELVPKIIKTQIYSFILDNNASEHGARMTAMDNATENAEELKRDLKIMYNKARQAAITTEITEIAAGAEALGS